MISVTLTKLYESVSSKVGKEAAENLTNFIEQKISTELENKVQLLVTKEDLLKVESKLELKIESKFGELDKKISELKAEIIKWMFLFWIGQIATTFGLVLAFIRK